MAVERWFLNLATAFAVGFTAVDSGRPPASLSGLATFWQRTVRKLPKAARIIQANPGPYWSESIA